MPEDIAAEPSGDIGVLLVHGIGDHAEGQTLLSFGEPLIDWLREWMAGPDSDHARGHASVVQARLRALRTEAESPAYALVDIEVQRDRSRAGTHERWLFAEAWWGDSVQVPNTAALLTWMFTRIPLLVIWHFFGGNRGAPIKAKPPATAPARKSMWDTPVPGWVAVAAKFLAIPPLIALMQLVVGLALVLWVVPIGPWRQGLLAVVRVLTLTLGDSYVLLEQDVQHAALVERVRRSLHWLGQRVQRVVVIAHSQGGAIAHEALSRSPLAGVDMFISVGSGLEKLAFLRQVRQSRMGLWPAACVAPLVLIGVLGLLSGLFGWVPATGLWWLLPAASLGFGALAAISLAKVPQRYHRALAGGTAGLALADGTRHVTWFDVHASLDLVPMGEASLLADCGFVQQVPLRNECSLVYDHVTYFNSRCGFSAWCWQAMSQVSKLGLFSNAESAAVRQLGLWHGRRAFALGFGSNLAPLAVAVAALMFTETMAGLGESLQSALLGADLGWPARAIAWVARQAARLVGFLPGFQNEALDLVRRGNVLIAAAAAAGVITAWWMASVLAWRKANRSLWLRACAGQSSLTGKNAIWLGLPGAVLWCVAAMMPLLVILISARSPDAFSLGTLGAALVLAAAGSFGIMSIGAAVVPPWMAKDDTEFDILGRNGSISRIAWPAFTTFAALFYAALACWLWSVALASEFDSRPIEVVTLASALSWTLSLSRSQGLASRLALWVPFLLAMAAWTFSSSTASFVAGAGAVALIVVFGVAGWIRSRQD